MKSKAAKILIISIALIPIGDLLVNLNLLNVTNSRLLWLIDICFFIYASISLITDFEFESRYFKAIIYIFIFYQFINISRGFFFSTDNLKAIFKEPQNFFGFVVPLFVFFDKRFINIVGLFKAIYALGLFFLILNVCFPSLLIVRLTAQSIIPSFAIGCGFLLLNAIYLSNRKVNVSFLVILLSALSYTYLARRSSAFTLYGFLISSYLLNALNNSTKFVFKLFPLIIGIALSLLFYPNKYSLALTEKINDRLYEDSRTALYDAFFIEMNEFTFFGKGMNGTYYYPMDESEQEDGITYSEVEYRNGIETGYLQLYLTGGLINVTLFVLLMLPAAFLGTFRSSNQFARACGLMIFLWLLDMFLFGFPQLSIHYVIIWICVGICYKVSIRKKTDQQIKNEFVKYGLL